MAYLRKKKDTYYIVVRNTGGVREKWLRVGKVSQKKATEALKKVEGELVNNRFGFVEDSKVTLEHFIEAYLKFSKSTKAENTFIADRKALRNWQQFLGVMNLKEINTQDIERYKVWRLKAAKPQTVNNEISCLRHLLNTAIKWKYLHNNPAKDVKLLKLPKTPPRFLSQTEIDRLFEQTTPWLKPFLVIALNTGMRKGEILNLKWQNIDFERKQILVQSSEHFNTKNYDFRAIPINQALLGELLYLKNHWPHPTHVKILKRTAKQTTYVICNAEGLPIEDIKSAFGRLCRKANLKNVSPHTLRHTFASHLVMAGVDLPIVQKYLGHKDVKTTMVYAHLSTEHLARHVERIGFNQRKEDKNMKTKSMLRENSGKVFVSASTDASNYLKLKTPRDGLEPPT